MRALQHERRPTCCCTEIATLDELLQAHAAELGSDFTAYRNHTYRVVNLCVALSSGDSEQLEKIAIAAAFHDMGIWTDGTFDYLQPSIRLASAHLAHSGRAEWTPEITAMILEHHKISAYQGRSTLARRALPPGGLGGRLAGAAHVRAVPEAPGRGLRHVAQRRLSQAARPAFPQAPADASLESIADDATLSGRQDHLR